MEKRGVGSFWWCSARVTCRGDVCGSSPINFTSLRQDVFRTVGSSCNEPCSTEEPFTLLFERAPTPRALSWYPTHSVDHGNYFTFKGKLDGQKVRFYRLKFAPRISQMTSTTNQPWKHQDDVPRRSIKTQRKFHTKYLNDFLSDGRKTVIKQRLRAITTYKLARVPWRRIDRLWTVSAIQTY